MLQSLIRLNQYAMKFQPTLKVNITITESVKDQTSFVDLTDGAIINAAVALKIVPLIIRNVTIGEYVFSFALFTCTLNNSYKLTNQNLFKGTKKDKPFRMRFGEVSIISFCCFDSCYQEVKNIVLHPLNFKNF